MAKVTDAVAALALPVVEEAGCPLGTTMVVVTHEKDLVDHFGKRVVTIDSGRVVNDSVGGYVGGRIHV